MGLTDHYIPKVIVNDGDELFEKTQKVFKDISDEFRNGPKMLIFLIPHRITVDEKYRRDMLSIYNIEPDSIDLWRPKVMFTRLVREFELKGFDLTSYFLQGNPSTLYYDIDGHWNVEGNRVAAEALFPYILDMMSDVCLQNVSDG